MKVFSWLAGRTPEGSLLVDTQQAMAAYELGEFPEYSHISLPILRYYLERLASKPEETPLLKPALLWSEARLGGSNA